MNALADIHVRVVSRRKGGTPSQPDEVVIDVDRSHPILGNRHVLRNHKDSAERARVIEAYKADLQDDLRHQGPMTQALRSIAARAATGERIALRCWCAPDPCHAHLLAQAIGLLATGCPAAEAAQVVLPDAPGPHGRQIGLF